jgi:hypothetical protein
MGIPDYIARILSSRDQHTLAIRLVCNGMTPTLLGLLPYSSPLLLREKMIQNNKHVSAKG